MKINGRDCGLVARRLALTERIALWISLVVVAMAAVFLSVVGFRASRSDNTAANTATSLPSWAASDDRLFDWDEFHERVLSEAFKMGHSGQKSS